MNSSIDLLGDLEEVISHGSMQRRIAALKHVTDVFMASSPTAPRDWVEAIDELFVRLVANIEEAARRILAEQLSEIPHAPLKIIQTLAFDQSIDVARPILSKSEALDERSIIEIVQTRNQQYLLAVSSRMNLSQAVTDALILRDDREVIHQTVRNNGAKFSDDGYRRLIDKVEDDDDLAKFLSMRPDLPRHVFLEVLLRASEEARKILETIRPEHGQEIEQVVTTVTASILSKSIGCPDDCIETEKRIEVLKSEGRLNEEELANLAMAGNRADSMAIFAALATLPADLIERAMTHEREELILLIAKTIELSRYTVKAILTLRSGSEGVSEIALEKQLRNYERLKTPTAQQAVRFFMLRDQQNFQASA